ncbi:hypothetical protein PFLUV_G00151320 [Perca fluviatilis]|uniref:Uncharacterized protein n=1 Tax=Perca fluviatilis TaxID=8168 RepID=A0A6A5EQ61_PERFL|nr:hypothetical protein PFLUV_G00151320 [Perca fluviatilis]
MKLLVDRCTGVLRTGLVCDSVAPFHINITSKGTAMSAEWMEVLICPNGHSLWKWNSQPVMKFGMQAGDFLLSTNILFKGILQERNSEAICRLQGKDVVVIGDGRNDSPGHCAQYCSYTTMELDTKEIIHVATIDKRQTSWNSNIMEKEGFIQTVDKLSRELKLVEICTDAHIQIGALMNPDKGRYKDLGIHHSLDMWHGSEGERTVYSPPLVEGHRQPFLVVL